jgi:tetrahydromethanopterin S-methyltransferase subunit D
MSFSLSSSGAEQCRLRLADELPVNMQVALGRAASVASGSSVSKLPTSAAPSAEAIQRAVASIVRKSATGQSIKGVVTAGVLKAGYYAWQKIKKRFSA